MRHAIKIFGPDADIGVVGNVAMLKRPVMALVVVALAAAIMGLPARASAGGGSPLDQMEEVVAHMQSAVADILGDLEWQLENAPTEDAQWAAYVNAVNSIESKRQQKLAAIANIAGKVPPLQEAKIAFQAEINEIAAQATEEAASLLENADPPELPTTTTVPLPTTTTTVAESTTTTQPRQSTTTTTTKPAPTTTTKPPPPPTTQPAAPPTTAAPTTTPAPPTTVAQASVPSSPTTTTTVPGLLASAGGGGSGGSSLSDLGVRLDGTGASNDESAASPTASPDGLDLQVLTSFQAPPGLMDGTGLLVEYVGSSLPGPVAAPVISVVAIFEMVVRALLSGTQAFVGPALVFGLYSAYRSLVVVVARRRQGVASV